MKTYEKYLLTKWLKPDSVLNNYKKPHITATSHLRYENKPIYPNREFTYHW